MATPYSVLNTRSLTDAGTPVTPGVAVTGTPTIYSDMWSGESADGYSLTAFASGTLTGTWTLWYTNIPQPDLTNDNDWTQDTSFVPVNPAGAAAKFTDDGGNAKAWRKRLKYVNASGTGTIRAFVTIPRFHY